MIDTNQIRQRMDKVVDIFGQDAGTIRTGRANPGLIENISVAVYGGQQMRLKELGSITVPDVRFLVFQPWDQSIIAEIKNGIMAANLGFTPVVDGQLIRIALPQLTTEQREDYVRLLGRKLEGAREMIRGVRGDNRKDLVDAKNEKMISEDEYKRDEAELQKITDEYMEKLEQMAEKKEKEIRGE